MAFLAERGSLLGLRVSQLTSAANNLVRKVCVTPADARAWLDPALDGAEQARLRAYLAEADPSVPG